VPLRADAMQMWDLYQRQLIDTKVDIWVSWLLTLSDKCNARCSCMQAEVVGLDQLID
jgi:hypothetical protein